jgi:hypothetical protein
MEISGKLANVVFYKMNGKNFARIAPTKVTRTANMKSRNRNFGSASSNAKVIRIMLAGLLPFPKHKPMQSRFSGAIAKWIGRREIKDIPAEKNLLYLSDFEFNDKCRIRQRLRLDLSFSQPADNMLELHIPEFVPTDSIVAPEGTLSVTLTVCAAPINLERCMASQHISRSIEIPYSGDSISAQTIQFPVNTQPGTLIVTACALRYTVMENGTPSLSKQPAYMPGGVVDARYC